MKTIGITQKTIVNISFYEGVTDERCEEIAEMICEKLYIKLDNKNHNLDYSYNKGSHGDYQITFTEEGYAKYYPSSSWYDPDEYDDPSTLGEYEFEEAIDKIHEEETTDIYETEIDTVSVYESAWGTII